MRNTYVLTEAAIQLAIFIVLFLVFLYVPLLSMIVPFFLSLPFIILTMRRGYGAGLVLLVAAIILSSWIGSFLSMLVAVMFGTVGIVIGVLLVKQKNRYLILMVTTLVFLVNLVVDYIISVKFFGIDIIAKSITMLDHSFRTAFNIMQGMGQEVPKQLQEFFQFGLELLKYVTPTMFVLSALAAAYLTILASSPILKRLNMATGAWPPFRHLTLPKPFLWCYMLVLIVMFFPLEKGTFAFIIVVNFYLLLQFLFLIQGFSFLYYVAAQKRIAKAFVVIGTLFCFLFWFFTFRVIALLGIIDVGFELRKRIQ
ncbi:YybS family protein [Anoxybacteroides tepidamans]|uniref:YybS family protein n=1 Tax=Anoxybacteroides tepidamans TaxID=265948 RepID=UPI00047F0C24|nr:YybS family protein [Anoxybacillus tepidamans]